MRPDLAWLASGFTADASKILFDQPGAAYDQLHATLERVAPLPFSLRGRALLVGAVLFIKHTFAGKTMTIGPLGRFVNEVADDTLTETLKRVVQHAGKVTCITQGPARKPLSHRIDSLTRIIAPWMGQKDK